MSGGDALAVHAASPAVCALACTLEGAGPRSIRNLSHKRSTAASIVNSAISPGVVIMGPPPPRSSGCQPPAPAPSAPAASRRNAPASAVHLSAFRSAVRTVPDERRDTIRC